MNCESRDSHLVKIDSLDENNFIVQLVKTSSSDRIWIGIRLFFPGIYKWTDGTVATFTRWYDGAPDDGYSATCGQISITGERAGYWHDLYCLSLYSFVCERAPQ